MPATIDTLLYVLGLEHGGLKRNAKEADAIVNRLTKSMTGALKRIGVAAMAGFGAYKFTDFVKNITLTAARAQELNIVLENTGKVAGYSSEYLAQEERKIKALGITTQASRNLLIRFMQSQLEVGKAANIARAAQDLAVIGMMDSSQAAETLTYAIAAQRPILLRQFGIVTDLGEVFGNYAKQLGKSAEDLTEVEKRTAMYNLVMENASRVTGTYEAAMTTAGKQFRSLNRYFTEAANAIGEHLLPAFSGFVTVITDVLKNVRALFDPTGTLMAKYTKMKKTFDASAGSINVLIARYKELRSKQKLTTDESAEYERIIKQIALAMPNVTREYDAQGRMIGIVVTHLDREIERRRELLKLTEHKLYAKLMEEWKEAVQQVRHYTAEQKYLVANERIVREEIAEATKAFLEKSKYTREARYPVKQYSEVVKENQEQIDKWADKLREATQALKIFRGETVKAPMPELPPPPPLPKPLSEIPLPNVDEYLKETERWVKETIRIDENRYRWLYEHEEISLANYVAFLRNKLSYTEQYSDQWMAIQARIEAVKQEAEDKDEQREDKLARDRQKELDEIEEHHGFLFAAYDSFWNSLYDLDMTGSERRKAIHRSMNAYIIGLMADQLKQEIKNKLASKAITESIKRSELATYVAFSAKYIALAAKEAAAAVAAAGKFIYQAVAKIFSAHAGIPWVGVAIATAFVAAMMSQIGRFKKFAGGGLVEGLLAGQDKLMALLTAGEYVLPKPAVARIGVPTLEHMRTTGKVPRPVTINIDMGGFSFAGMERKDAYLTEDFITTRVSEAVKEALEKRELTL